MALRSPAENGIRDLVMQRQPTPRFDPSRTGHFLRRDQAMTEAPVNSTNLSELSDLPSNIGDKNKEEIKKWVVRDQELNKALKLRGWEGKQVHAFVNYFFCAQRRCIYTPIAADFKAAKTVLQQKLESVSGRFFLVTYFLMMTITWAKFLCRK